MDANLFYEEDDVLSPELCEKIINMFEKDDLKHEGGVQINEHEFKVINDFKQSTELSITMGGEKWKEIDDILHNVIIKCETKYLNFIKDALLDKGANIKVIERELAAIFTNLHDTGYNLCRIDKGQKYEWHEDDGGLGIPGSIIGCIIYLNTLDESDGGKTEFLCGKKIQPKTGKLLFFPTTWSNFHRGCEVKGKSKYTINTIIKRE